MDVHSEREALHRRPAWIGWLNWPLLFLIVLPVYLIVHTVAGPNAIGLFVLGFIAIGATLHHLMGLRQHRHASAHWDEITSRFAMQPMPDTAERPRHPLQKHLQLTPLEGTYEGTAVRIESEHLPFSQHPRSVNLWFIGTQTFVTRLSTSLPGEDTDLYLKLERRKGGEKTDTHLAPADRTKERSAFEQNHHLFTEDQETAQTLLDPEMQETIERLGPYRTLRVWKGTVTLTFDGVPDPTRIQQGFEGIVALADRAGQGLDAPSVPAVASGA